MNEEQVFLAALDLPDAAARAAYLDEACGADARLRRQFEALLAAHFRSGEFLDVPAAAQMKAPSLNSIAIEGDPAPAEKSHDEPDGLSFLTPPTRPDSLGWLGHYEVLEVLGKGGFGIVFRAFDETLRRVVAIKVLAPEMAATSPARKRFLREAWASARVRHENVVQVYAVGEQPLPYLVMEFVPGETLQQRLDRTGPLDAEEVARVGRQIAEGLAAAHATGLIHRDIKPANLLLTGDGPNQHVKITDFGLARAADDASLTQSGVIAGTPMYMAPEQAQCDALDHRADLFSLGGVLYVMCTGRPPFRASNTLAVLRRVAEDTPRPIPDLIPEAPRWLCDLISRLHAKRPVDRIGTAREVADLLGSGLAEMQHARTLPLAAVAKPPRREDVPASRPHSRPGRWAAAAVLVLLLGGLGLTETSGVTNVHGTVIRLFSPEGTLVVEVDDPGVSVRIDGSELVITGAGAREIRLKPGSYTVEASKDGKVVSRELVSVTKNGRKVVRVTQVAAPKDPDRRAATYVLSIGGTVRVNGEGGDLRNARELPREPFRLTTVQLRQNKKVSDAGLAHFKDCKNLTDLDLRKTKVTAAGIDEVKKASPRCKIVWDGGVIQPLAAEWERSVAALPAEEQVKAVGARLKELNPGFDGEVTDQIVDRVVTELAFSTDRVTDISPVRALSRLQKLGVRAATLGKGLLADLSPLKGMPLRQLECVGTQVNDLSPLVGMGLKVLNLSSTPVSDLTPLKDMKLEELYIESTQVTDLSPLTEMKLRVLWCSFAKVSDLSPLKGMPVTSLILRGTPIRDLKPLEAMPLKLLWILDTNVTDLSPLKGMPLEDFRLTPGRITRGLEILRGSKSLKTIGIDDRNAWPPADFWVRHGRGEFNR